MKKKRRPSPSGPEIEVDLIPVLSCMFLLVPALLLAMEAANWASIPVSPPQVAASATDHDTPTEPSPRLAVQVRSDGFAVSLRGRGRSTVDDADVIPRQDAYDFTALMGRAKAAKTNHPRMNEVLLSAEGDVPLQTLVETMDALRGESCDLSEGTPKGDCLMWRVEIEA